MPDSNDDPFGENDNEAVDEFDRLTDLLFQRISDVTEDENVPDELLPLLLLRLSLTTRMMAYATSVAKPSAGGLKLDLDRFRHDAEDLIREMKKDADVSSRVPRRQSQRPHWRRMRLEQAWQLSRPPAPTLIAIGFCRSRKLQWLMTGDAHSFASASKA